MFYEGDFLWLQKNLRISSGNLHDGKASIPLLKEMNERLSLSTIRFYTMDTDYDYEPIYQHVHHMNQQSNIAYNRRNEPEILGFDQHFAPTCFREHFYRYDSYDKRYQTLKYTQAKECNDCTLAQEGICQKVFKMNITKDLRKYTAPARGSQAWKCLYKKRTALERVNRCLKEFFKIRLY